ncbi:MAG: diadenylate cyclase, partial [Phycisphaerae bacterium]
MFTTRLTDLLGRLAAYPPLVVALELAIIWVCVYAIVRFVQGTRAAGALKGLLVVGIFFGVMARVLGGAEVFQRIGLLYDRFLGYLAISLVIVFQPELRRALVRLGETPFFRSSPKEIALVVDEICEACKYLSKARFGAIIVIERSIAVAGVVEGGTPMNAELTSRLLQTIFFPGSALHDLAVVVKGKRIAAAGVQLPLAEPEDMPDKRLGSRHRAAVGLSRECDALVVVVSEESGKIRL